MMSSEMQYRIDPKSGNRLSALGFGCMRFPSNAALREELVTAAVKAGINYFDTAYGYPGSETALGSILKKHCLREKVYIADKLPHYKCKSPEDIEKLFAESLSRLQTDYIDYYLIHNIGSHDVWERLMGLGIAEWIAEKKAKGIIREIGFSFHGKAVAFLPLLEAYNWDFCQIQYNYMNENYQAGTAGLKAIHKRGMAAVIMEPLLGGRLAQNLPKAAKDLFDKSAPDHTPAAWGFKWLYDKPEVTVVLSGMNAMEQLSENLDIVGNSPVYLLSDEERAVYGKVYGAISEAYKIPCTGCNYCMPCPHGVDIPTCFSCYNDRAIEGKLAAKRKYLMQTSMKTQSLQASLCLKCGQCEQLCPQNIAISEELSRVAKTLEGIYYRPLSFVMKKFMRL